MDKKPLVSIITVVFNGEKYIEQTIKSVINQTYKNIEYIVIDGGSTDGTLDVVRKYDEFISYWKSEPDKGLYDAMNKGIKKAKGELVGMINSDDWYEPFAVNLMVNSYIDNQDKRIFHADRYDVLVDGDRKIKRFNSSRFKFIYYGMTYNHPSMFITKKEYENRLYNTKLKALSDYQFVLEAFLNSPKRFHYVPQAIVNYRLDGLSGVMDTKRILYEGFIARKNAGLGFLKNIISYCIRFIVRMLY